MIITGDLFFAREDKHNNKKIPFCTNKQMLSNDSIEKKISLRGKNISVVPFERMSAFS